MSRTPDGEAPARREPLLFTLDKVEFADSGAGDGQRTLKGHAAVFERLSHDLGGFRTKIAKGAFTKALDRSPDVHLVWDHDMRYVFARTINGTLELREDPYGLHVWARLAPTSYAADLEVLMERGDIDQMSFACFIGADEWVESSDGTVVRTILEVDELFDVTVCAQGAFPQTDSSLLLASAREAGRVQHGRATPPADAAPGTPADDGTAPTAAAQDGPGGAADAPDQPVAGALAAARARVRATRHSHHQ